MIKVEKTIAVATKISEGTYRCKQIDRRDGKTMNDTRFEFEITEGDLKGESLVKYVNNSKVTWTDSRTGKDWTSEDFFMNDLAHQLCTGTVNYGEILEKLDNDEEVDLYVTYREGSDFYDVSARRPRTQVAEELGL